MEEKRRLLFSNYTFENWKNLILFAIFLLYLFLFVSWVWKSDFTSGYGGDYLAFWSVGKIAEERGYSEIYDLNNLRSYQAVELKALSLLHETEVPSYSPIPAPIFSFFVLPFQLLSNIDLQLSYWIWTAINLVVLVGYLVFFLQKIIPKSGPMVSGLKVLIPVLISFPVFNNIFEGQVQVFLLVCVGEFIRYALCKKPILSGLWLGGLLLKPQLLILIIPIFLIMRNWKALMGFFVSFGVVLITSLSVSGFAGMKALIKLWTKYSVGLATNAPEYMINWRMVGVNLNTILNASFGWVISVLGIALTFLAVLFLIKRSPPYGTPQWVLTMLGVFSATLAVTWHSHYHMAIVLIPFLAYASIYKLLPEKLVFFWVIVTPGVMFGMMIVSVFFLFWAKINIYIYEWILIGFSGFVVNLSLLIMILQILSKRNLMENRILEK